MKINFTFKRLYLTYSYQILITLMITSFSWSQTQNDDLVEKTGKLTIYLYGKIVSLVLGKI